MCLTDLRVLGKGDFRSILAWRLEMQDLRDAAVKAAAKGKKSDEMADGEGGSDSSSDEGGDEDSEDEDDREENKIQREIDRAKYEKLKKKKREKKKEREKMAKFRERQKYERASERSERAVRTPAGATTRHIRSPRRGHHQVNCSDEYYASSLRFSSLRSSRAPRIMPRRSAPRLRLSLLVCSLSMLLSSR